MRQISDELWVGIVFSQVVSWVNPQTVNMSRLSLPSDGKSSAVSMRSGESPTRGSCDLTGPFQTRDYAVLC